VEPEPKIQAPAPALPAENFWLRLLLQPPKNCLVSGSIALD